MSAHVWLAAAGFADWIGPAIVAIFFFILPIVRSIREAREKQQQAERRAAGGATPTPAPRAPVETDMDEARRKWEALLRGEEVDAPPKPPSAPRPAEAEMRRSPPPPSAPAPDFGASLDAPRKPDALPSQEPVLSEIGADTSFDEARLAQVEEETRTRDDKQRRDDLLFAERESTAVRADVAQWIGASASNQPAPPAADLTRRRNVFGGGPGLATRAGLRRAVLASELFGRPVALRDGSDEAGPVGLRK